MSMIRSDIPALSIQWARLNTWHSLCAWLTLTLWNPSYNMVRSCLTELSSGLTRSHECCCLRLWPDPRKWHYQLFCLDPPEWRFHVVVVSLSDEWNYLCNWLDLHYWYAPILRLTQRLLEISVSLVHSQSIGTLSSHDSINHYPVQVQWRSLC